MILPTRTRYTICVLLFFFLGLSAKSNVVVSGFTDSSAGSVTLEKDLVFTLDARTNDFKLVLKDYFPEAQSSYSNQPVSHWNHVINGEQGDQFTFFMLRMGEQGTEKDLVFGLFPVSGSLLEVGSTITIEAGTMVFSSIAGAPLSLGDNTFSGHVFLTDTTGNPITGTQAIPEPALLSMIFGFVAFFVLWRSRKDSRLSCLS